MYLASEYSPITKNGGMARIIIIIARMMMINMTIEAMMSHITKVCYQTLVGNIRIEGGWDYTEGMVMVFSSLYKESKKPIGLEVSIRSNT